MIVGLSLTVSAQKDDPKKPPPKERPPVIEPKPKERPKNDDKKPNKPDFAFVIRISDKKNIA